MLFIHRSRTIDSFPRKFDKLKKRFQLLKLSDHTIFILLGIAATIWFLIRVIPKPQRAYYPCMRAAAPLMSSFVIYVLSLGGTVIVFRKSLQKFRQAHYKKALFLGLTAVSLLIVFGIQDARDVFGIPDNITWTKGVFPDGSNNPMGKGFGVFPGRVAWVMNKNATNENCSNTVSDAFFMSKNNNQDTINKMTDNGIKMIGGAKTVKESWNKIFKSFNKRKNGSETGYVQTQTIFIKINNGQAGWAINQTDLSETGTTSSTGVRNAAIAETTPAAVLSIVRQLVDSCNVPQEKIYVAEPMTHVYKSTSDLILAKYPKVKILDKDDKSKLGRTQTTGWREQTIIYSDKGSVMPDAIEDAIMNEMYNADYQINIAALKAHARSGVTLCAKQHFGSHGYHDAQYSWGSFYLHDGLICAENDQLTQARGDYKIYRVLTDLMGHDKLGRNTVLFMVDGLWGGIESVDMAVKWKSAPFNNDWPNSLFMSQDEVALESVCIDFLRSEANINTAFKDRPFFPAIDDYLHQAADSSNWPKGIIYDPEGDGTRMPGSLGVHEHWNNDADKQYTRNLSKNGLGIELMSYPSNLVAYNYQLSSSKPLSISLGLKVYPNPCSDIVNITYSVINNNTVFIELISLDGRRCRQITRINQPIGVQTEKMDISGLSSGNYICRVVSGVHESSVKLGIK